MRRIWRLGIGITSAALLAGGVAAAAGSGEGDRGVAEATLKEVEASPKKDVAAEMTLRARAALARADKLRAAGDEPHARLADSLARTWAEAARDVLRATEVEEKAAVARRSATDAGAGADRERALLEEGIAQSGRLRGQLEAAEREAKEQPARTSAAANEKDTTSAKDGGAPKAPATKPKPVPVTAPAKKDGGA